MAQDTGSNLVNFKNVDLDDVGINTLIIGKSYQNLGPIAAHLRRRGWPTRLVSTVNDAVLAIADQNPDVVFVSFTNADSALMRLVDLLALSQKTICLGMVETEGDPTAVARLNAARMRHKILRPANGPMLYRAVRGVLGETKPLKQTERAMIPVDLESIPTDRPVAFRAYIRLELNDKYFLYLRPGRTLQPEQMRRLRGRSIESLFVRTDDEDLLVTTFGRPAG